jgi:hypothetical protein
MSLKKQIAHGCVHSGPEDGIFPRNEALKKKLQESGRALRDLFKRQT